VHGVELPAASARYHFGVRPRADDRENEDADAGLCARCQFSRRIPSARGSVFYLCERSVTDPNFPKYPVLPVLRCRGFVDRSI